jgi:capsular polysaccharide biosynthesis protein
LFKSKDIILTLRDKLYDYKEIDTNKKIYISRRDSGRASIENEEAVEKYFEDLGFISVTLSGMGVMEQKELFEDASIVVGRSGTSFTNMLFMNNDAKIIDISTDIEFSNYDFRFVAKLLDLDYTNIIIENFTDGNHLLQKLKEFATIIQ